MTGGGGRGRAGRGGDCARGIGQARVTPLAQSLKAQVVATAMGAGAAPRHSSSCNSQRAHVISVVSVHNVSQWLNHLAVDLDVQQYKVVLAVPACSGTRQYRGVGGKGAAVAMSKRAGQWKASLAVAYHRQQHKCEERLP